MLAPIKTESMAAIDFGPTEVGHPEGEGWGTVQLDIQTKVLSLQKLLDTSFQGNYMGACRPGPSTEFWRGSCCNSHSTWRCNI